MGEDVAGYTPCRSGSNGRAASALRDDVEEGAEGRPGATLIVRVDPARALDVAYKGQQILERINGYFGYRAVAELRILQAPLPERAAPAPVRATPPPCAAPELAGIADERLRAALASLKSGLMSRGDALRGLGSGRALPFLHLAFRRVLPYCHARRMLPGVKRPARPANVHLKTARSQPVFASKTSSGRSSFHGASCSPRLSALARSAPAPCCKRFLSQPRRRGRPRCRSRS